MKPIKDGLGDDDGLLFHRHDGHNTAPADGCNMKTTMNIAIDMTKFMTMTTMALCDHNP